MSKNDKIKKGTNKSFGLVFFTVFLIIGLWPLLNENTPRIWSIIISLAFLILGLLNSKILTPLNTIWFKFGELLGLLISPVVMALIFFLVVTPTGIIMKLFKKDLLNKRFNKSIKSYWLKKEKAESTMKQQF